MRIAIFSDLHDNFDAFYSLVEDATRQQTDRLIYLGDVGHDPLLFSELQKRQIPCIFGNWEVSGLRRMNEAQRAWVATWPAVICEGDAIYAHATPDMPAEAATTAKASQYIQGGIGWLSLFPRLHSNEDACWRAFAVLEEKDLRVAFHGHTHIQQVWAWETSTNDKRHLRSFSETEEFILQPGSPQLSNRYLIGVGSAGQPNDGPQGKYVIYDQDRQTVQVRRI